MITIDIALYPEQKARMISREMQAKLLDNQGQIDFTKSHIPHISLAMLTIRDEDLTLLKLDLPEYADNFEIVDYTNGRVFSGLDLENTPQLIEQQQKVIQIAKKYAVDIEPDPQQFNEFSRRYIKSFLEHKSNPDNFEPHVTLGTGKLQQKDFYKFSFKAELAIFRMANFCTCVEKL